MKPRLRTSKWLNASVVAGVALSLTSTGRLGAQTIWDGPSVTFTKADGADWTLAANQDRLTANVWLTRAGTEGLFNIAVESSYDRGTWLRPTDTEWAFAGLNGNPPTGVAAVNHASLTFDTWYASVATSPPGSVGRAGVLHLISDNIYLDITFNSWSMRSGGFSYTRSSVPEPEAWGLSVGVVCALFGVWHRSRNRPCVTQYMR